MTGMKEGAGDDPFADDPEEERSEQAVDERQPADTPHADTSSGGPAASLEEPAVQSDRQYPYFLTRDTVKEGRTNEAVFFLRDQYATHEDDVHDAVEELLGDDVYLTDLREAMVATADAEAIAAQLREWGHGVK
ncbi:hypothetical protein [Halosegnis marinus]|uniref:Uncharacterized protein n=1 Tax=Halosegnis marinus TaxID=3034023 RepID=A0ABD5ZT50_9EURY|nr:hypothetical protein [Halosegnis sp. DT85]